ncbi:MAG: hypothetical protein LQ340_002274 [Diploschistes diacapsis]|nr:MAG: hypothetical protein LQ340_002274 [Diploschistes diacapsis]
MSTSGFHIGQRISYSSALCTIRFIGSVAGTKGEWLGVEWDDPKLGKHAGEHNGIQYFKCLSPNSTAASFVRPSRPADPALSFLDALRQKYAPDDAPAGHQEDNPIEFSGKLVEEVGFEKIRQQQAILQELRIVILDGMRVTGPQGPSSVPDIQSEKWQASLNDIAVTCPKIRELDLSRNLIERWVDVVGICKALHDLRRLVLSENRIHDLDLHGFNPAIVQEAFEGVQELMLDSTFITWPELTSLLPSFSALQTLSFKTNNLSHPLTALPSLPLKSISLSFNPLGTLSSISALHSLTKLTSLSLASCSISTLPSLSRARRPPLFLPPPHIPPRL